MPISSHPLASSSRLPPLPSSVSLTRTPSSTTISSDSSDHSPPGPLTPPDTYTLDRPLDYYDSPPSPPRSLQDRMHVAYATDNMHLAKVLLLKLQGIEVDGDNDPRIAAVRDEDFSTSFVPHGPLRLEADTELRLRMAEQRAHEARLQRQRQDRLRRCERVWDNSLRQHKSAKDRVARDKLDSEFRRRDQIRQAKERQRERARLEEAARAARAYQLRIASAQPRQLLSYNSLRDADTRFPKPSHLKQDVDDGLFLYDIMPSPPSRTMSASSPPSSRSPIDKDSLSLPRAQRELALKHAQSLSRSVPFAEVLTAMHGSLFGDDLTTDSPTQRSPLQTELLATLLHPVAKLNVKDQYVTSPEPIPTRVNVKNIALARVTRSSRFDSISSSSSSSATPSTVTRSGSWLSFASTSSFQSDSTALTTPPSSPLATSKPSISLTAPISTSSSPVPTCTRRSTSAPAVIVVDHPLAIPAPPKPNAKEALAVGRGRALTRQTSNAANEPSLSPTGLMHRVTRSVSNVIDFAAQLQRAYVKAAMLSAGPEPYGRSSSRSSSRSHSHSPVRVRSTSIPSRSSGGLKPVGYRVSSLDVHTFIAGDWFAGDDALRLQRTLIPLCPPSSDSISTYERVFPIPPPLPKSPFRRQFLPGQRLSRLRPVANPILLRLQALHNVCAVQAIAWERAREGTLASGKEKVVQVAWDGIGRSSLGWEVRIVY